MGRQGPDHIEAQSNSIQRSVHRRRASSTYLLGSCQNRQPAEMNVLVLSFWTTARRRLQVESDLRGVAADTGIPVVESFPPTKMTIRQSSQNHDHNSRFPYLDGFTLLLSQLRDFLALPPMLNPQSRIILGPFVK